MTREHIILLTLIVYQGVLITIGVLAQRLNRDPIDFFLAGRRLGPWVTAISASASSSSAWTLLGVSGFAYASGLSALWLFPACVGGFLLNWFLVAPRLRDYSRRHGSVTLTEVLAGPQDHPLNRRIVILASAIIIVSLGFYIGAQYQAAGKAFERVFGLAATPSIIVGGGIVLFYTLLGGFWAVSLTDTLQGLLMAGTSVVVPVGAWIHVGGWDALAVALREVEIDGFLSLTGTNLGLAGIGFAAGLLGIGLGYPGQPHVVNRFMALTEGAAALKHARFIAMTWAILVYAGMLMLGLCGRVLFRGVADPETIFFVATSELFHPVIAGVMVAGVLSAVMSTADSQLLVAAASVTHDLKVGVWRPERMLFRSRVVVLLVGGGAIFLALAGDPQIFTSVLSAWTVMGTAFGPLVLVTLLKGPVGPTSTFWAMSLGGVMTLFANTFTETPAKFAERTLPFLIILVVTWATTPKPTRAA